MNNSQTVEKSQIHTPSTIEPILKNGLSAPLLSQQDDLLNSYPMSLISNGTSLHKSVDGTHKNHDDSRT